MTTAKIGADKADVDHASASTQKVESRAITMNSIRLTPHQIALGLLLCVVILMVAGFVSVVLKFEFGYSSTNMFNLDREANVPTWFSSLLLFSNALLLCLVALAKSGSRDIWRRHWVVHQFEICLL